MNATYRHITVLLEEAREGPDPLRRTRRQRGVAAGVQRQQVDVRVESPRELRQL